MNEAAQGSVKFDWHGRGGERCGEDGREGRCHRGRERALTVCRSLPVTWYFIPFQLRIRWPCRNCLAISWRAGGPWKARSTVVTIKPRRAGFPWRTLGTDNSLLSKLTQSWRPCETGFTLLAMATLWPHGPHGTL
ncbi:hypothetical protein EYF80_001660 [Liparis tanakae]|uniref:Uncharacterized protein n=1 Tax=Liparis tanakae TaxID=230148 RepID=A0A4Z2JCY6_9TELE|nr:hypothetical protein EYF80_001660 [Liparis tanakae]